MVTKLKAPLLARRVTRRVRTLAAAAWISRAASRGDMSPRSAAWIADQPASSTSGNRASGGYVIIAFSMVSRVISSR